MKYYSYLIKPASSLCNLRCRYCFYHDVSDHRMMKSFGVMSETTMNALIQKALDVISPSTITFAFQGGEPTVAGLNYFRSFVQCVNKHRKDGQVILYAIQTNGYTLDMEWVTFLKEHKFLVGISIDGYQENHNYFRINSGNQATFERVYQSYRLLKSNEVDVNILTVLSKQLARKPKELYEFYQLIDAKYIQLIPCLPPLGVVEDEFSLTPELFASFYKEFYSYWEKDYRQGQYLSVTLFDNIIPMFKGIAPSQCGMLGFCSPQYVVESDGSVYPCDFYVLDEYKCGNIVANSLEEIRKSSLMSQFLHESKRVSPLCSNCKFKSICHGNCKRMNIVYFNNDTYCGYQDFLEFAHESMMEIANKVIR